MAATALPRSSRQLRLGASRDDRQATNAAPERSSELLSLEPDADNAVDLAELLANKKVEVIVRLPGRDDDALAPKLVHLLATVTENTAKGHSVVVSRSESFETPASAARLLGVSRPTVVRWIKDGLLEDIPVGSDHRIPASSLRSLQRERIAAGRRAIAVLDGSAGPEAKERAEAARSRARERMARR